MSHAPIRQEAAGGSSAPAAPRTGDSSAPAAPRTGDSSAPAPAPDAAPPPSERASGAVRRAQPVTWSRLLRLGPKARVELVRTLTAPLVVALVPLFWVIDATHRASLTTLGRDQGIFQYIAWAVGRGDVDYRDIRDVNGPLVHQIHGLFLALGGADEHRFHLLDLTATAATFAVLGACLPGLVAKRTSRLERAAWGFAGAVVLMAQYNLYLYWNQAQRESFCDWFLLVSLGLQLLRAPADARRAKARVAAIGALSVVTWLGKPSFAVFSVMQLGVLLVDRDLPLGRRARAAWFAVGGAIGAAVPLFWLLRHGDPLAFARITLVDVPRVYRFMWAKSAPEILGEEGPIHSTTPALAVSVLLVALVLHGDLPRRALALALAPPCALLGVLAQQKGFGYHFHPMTATTQAGWLALVVALAERFRHAPRRAPLGRYASFGAAASLALWVASSMSASPHTRNVWILAGGETPERRLDKEYFDSFKTNDFFPWELREGARYLTAKTSPDARVQVYGMDPYLLFLAGRRSATPYIYAYDLDDDAALDGGWHNRPTDAQAAVIQAARDAHERDMLARLSAAPPEAFVFVDSSPLMTYPDAWEDFRHCCSASARWVASHYHPARSFGEVHVWMRDDRKGDYEDGFP